MENDFLIKKINAKVKVECHDKGNTIKTQWVVTTGTNLFQHWMHKKFKTEQNWADITSDNDNDEDELEIL